MTIARVLALLITALCTVSSIHANECRASGDSILFVMDTSGSMSNSAINTAKRTSSYLLDKISYRSNYRMGLIMANLNWDVYPGDNNAYSVKSKINKWNSGSGNPIGSFSGVANRTREVSTNKCTRVIIFTDAPRQAGGSSADQIAQELRNECHCVDVFGMYLSDSDQINAGESLAQAGGGLFCNASSVSDGKKCMDELFVDRYVYNPEKKICENIEGKQGFNPINSWELDDYIAQNETLECLDLSGMDLRFKNLEDKTLVGVNLSSANLEGKTLRGKITGSLFKKTHLKDSVFRATLIDSKFEEVHFEKTSFHLPSSSKSNTFKKVTGTNLKMNHESFSTNNCLEDFDFYDVKLNSSTLEGMRFCKTKWEYVEFHANSLFKNVEFYDSQVQSVTAENSRLEKVSLHSTFGDYWRVLKSEVNDLYFGTSQYARKYWSFTEVTGNQITLAGSSWEWFTIKDSELELLSFNNVTTYDTILSSAFIKTFRHISSSSTRLKSTIRQSLALNPNEIYFSGGACTGCEFTSYDDHTKRTRFFFTNTNILNPKFLATNFASGSFADNSKFYGAKFTELHLDGFSAKDSFFGDARFTKVTGGDNGSFVDCNFNAAVFDSFKFSNNLTGTSFRGIDFTKVKFPNMSGTTFNSNDFKGSNLKGVDFSSANMARALFRGVTNFGITDLDIPGEFRNFKCLECDFTGVRIKGNFIDAKITSSFFNTASFKGNKIFGNFSYNEVKDATLENVHFNGTLTKNNFQRAVLKGNLSQIEKSTLKDNIFYRSSLSGITISDSTFTNDQMADIDMTETIISNTSFDKCSFRTTNLGYAKLSDVTFKNEVNISNSDWFQTYLFNVTFDKVYFNDHLAVVKNFGTITGAYENRATLTIKNSSIWGVDFKEMRLGTNSLIKNTSISNSDFSNANFEGVKIHNTDIIGSKFNEIVLNNLEYMGGKLKRTDFSQAKFYGATSFINSDLRLALNFNTAFMDATYINSFKGSDLSDLDLSGMNLFKVDFTGSNLEYTLFDEARISDALFDSAIFLRTSFFDAVVTTSSFEDVDLSEAEGLAF